MRVCSAVVLVLVGVGMGVGLACGDSGGSGGSRDAGTGGPPSDKAWVRFGNLSPDAPVIDICVSPMNAGQWGTPMLASSGQQGGLTFPAMSRETYIDAGWLDFRAVAAGAADCSTPVGQDLTAQQLNPHGTYTITAVGLLTPGTTSAGPYRLQQYIEHQEPPAAGKARLRVLNVSPNSPPLWDGVVLDGGVWGTQLTEAEMGFRMFASGTGIVDGYQDIDPAPALPLTIRATRPQDTPDLYTAPIDLRPGAITAVWVIGLVGGTGDQRLGYFVCDETPPDAGGQTACKRQ
ncbi:MAG TPA: DUF4397 domain-containing protein [Myxococcaceae bacterium]|nr:DUF4397 domain-containing protein [Myxococcaceae bacterium]